MATLTSKLPRVDTPMITDPDLGPAIEKMLAPLTGAKLEKAQAAVRKVYGSAVEGSFSDILAAYRNAIAAATGDKET
jgi:hypothetical protein